MGGSRRLARTLSRGEICLYRFAPFTATIRGVPSEVILDVEDGMKNRCAVNLHNAVTVAQARLGRRVASLGGRRMQDVCRALAFSLGCG